MSNSLVPEYVTKPAIASLIVFGLNRFVLKQGTKESLFFSAKYILLMKYL